MKIQCLHFCRKIFKNKLKGSPSPKGPLIVDDPRAHDEMQQQTHVAGCVNSWLWCHRPDMGFLDSRYSKCWNPQGNSRLRKGCHTDFHGISLHWHPSSLPMSACTRSRLSPPGSLMGERVLTSMQGDALHPEVSHSAPR